MAGAPNSRGCDACRKQKKKCDQAKPKCSRCTRLKIDCVGSGERRYIFKQEKGRDSSTSGRSSPETKELRKKTKRLVISRTPSDEATRRGNAFISVLEIGDIRYALSNYGDILIHVPARLGRNQGLDAAVNALTVSWSSYRSGRRSKEALTSYAAATLALRKCFEDPATALASETLCAMYICTICQSFLFEPDDSSATSAEMIAQIMKAALRRPWQAGFDSEVLTIMCMPVLLDSLFSPKIEIESWLWRVIEIYEPKRTPGPRLAAPFESLQVKSLARFAMNIRSPETHILEIQEAYRVMRPDMLEMGKALNGIDASTAGLDQSSAAWEVASKTLTRVQAGYAMLLTMALISNYLLRRHSRGHQVLVDDARHMSNEILRTSRSAYRFRPLGSSAQPFALVTVSVTTEDEFLRLHAQEMIADYGSDFPSSNWGEVGRLLQDRLGIER